jgi:hypothetical protein
VADAGALAGTAEAAVGNQADLEAAARDDGRRVEHLLHARAAFRALVADDDDVAVVDFASHDGIAGLSLRVVALRLARVGQHVGCDGRSLDDGVIRCEVALEDGDTALFAVRVIDAVDDRAVEDLGVLDAVADRARDRQRVEVDQALLGELVHDGRDAAGLVEVRHVVLAGRAELRDVRRAARDLIEERCRQFDASLVRDGRQMKNGVRGAADAHVDRDGVLEGLARHDVARLDVLLDEVHERCTGALGKQAACARIGGRDCAVARQAHAEDFRQGVHRVGREEAGAGAATRAALRLEIGHLSDIHLAGSELAGCLEGLADADVMAVEASWQHRAARDDDGRDIEASRCHEHARHDLVAVRDQDEAIEARSHRNGLDRIGDELAARERVLHARVAHGDAVADTDSRELKGRAACCCDAELRSLGDFAQVDVARDDLVEGIADADQRLLEVLRTVAICMEQGTMCTACSTFFDNIASHKQLSYLSVLCTHT